jgi:hypothetical protein
MATDFRSGKDFPRRGRDRIGDFYWLARVFDKARAKRDDTIFDYIYPCPIDKGVFERWGITSDEFDQALKTIDTDEAVLAWAKSRISDAQRETANTWVIIDKQPSLDKQDAEEGVLAA